MYDLSGELTVILTTIWWLEKIGKDRNRWAISKQTVQYFDVEIFYPRKLNDLEVKKQYQIDITNRFAALENAGHK